MNNFTYYSPTEIVFGRQSEEKLAGLIRKYGGSRVMVVYGGSSAVRSGLIGRIESFLKDGGIEYVLFGGAQPNPTLSHAREGVAIALEKGIDFLLAVGGGSSIDTAKAIAHGIANPETDIWSFWTHEKELEKSSPVGAILTIPAAGSESSNSAVLTNEDICRKRGLSTDFNRPRFAIMNPELASTLPVYQVACGVTDIMMHTMDRYFHPVDNDLTDAIAEALLRTVIAHGPSVVADPGNYASMSEIMWAGSLSHNGLTGLGQSGDWAVHQLGHEMSAQFGLAHAASLSTVWEAWANYVMDAKPSRFARFARNVWGIEENDDAVAAVKGIHATVDYFASLGMPVCFSDSVGVQSDAKCLDLAYHCSFENTRTIGSFKVLSQQDIACIYMASNH